MKKKKSGHFDFPQHLWTFVQRMRDDETSHDVVFVVENQRFPAHRCLMGAASSVLRKMLTNGMTETNEREVVLKEVNVKAWKIVLDYIYSAKMELPNAEEAVQVLECAERFQIEELVKVISDYIERELDTSNCSEILATVDCLNTTKLRAAAMRTVVDNFYQVFYEDGFILLPFELVLEIFTCDKLVLRTELDIFVALVRWFMWRTTCEVSESEVPANETVKPINGDLARKVLSLFVEYEFVEPELTENSPLLFRTNGLVESGTNEDSELSRLFDCIDISKLSVNHLRRAGRLCRELCKETRTNYGFELAPVQTFSEKVVEKLLELDDNIPNIPVALYKRVPHGRKDVLFTFSHRFHNVQDEIQPDKGFGYQDSPEFEDPFRKCKWLLKAYFRGMDAFWGKNPTFLLSRTAQDSGLEKQSIFGNQMFMCFGKSNDESKQMVYSKYAVRDGAHKFGIGSGWGPVGFVPSSAFSGKNTVTVGAVIYFKSSDGDKVAS